MVQDGDQQDDGRIKRRRRTLKTGKLWFNNYQSVMDCQVRDVSETGARVRFNQAFVCPVDVALYFPRDEYEGDLRRCVTKWVRNNEAGLLFTSDLVQTRFDDITKPKLPWRIQSGPYMSAGAVS